MSPTGIITYRTSFSPGIIMIRWFRNCSRAFKPFQQDLVKRKIIIMKKLLSAIFVFAFFTMGISLSAAAQIYVKIRPAPPVVVRTVAPSPRHVWVEEEWKPGGNGYVYAGGYW